MEVFVYVYEMFVLYCDIKLVNFFVDEYGIVWIIDFGFVKIVDFEDFSCMGDFVGMFCYMVLEWFLGGNDYCLDIYLFGFIFYELVIG